MVGPRVAVVWEQLLEALPPGRRRLTVVDSGGGSGGLAVPLAALGHRVLVVDASPDTLATLARRAAEARVSGSATAVQGDADDLDAVAAAAGFAPADVVLVHGSLEHADDPAAVVAAAAALLQPGGVLSVVAANRDAAVLSRAIGGHLGAARAVLDDPSGRWGADDPLGRRFAPEELRALVEAPGLQVRATTGVRVLHDLLDLVPSAHLDGEAGAPAALLDLERALSARPAFAAVAAAVHLVAGKP